MKPKISVVIPVYNKAHFVAATIESVLAQSFTNYELILVNDGSTDHSLEVLEGFKQAHIKLINQENHGLSAARNAGIAAAQGEIIALLDADDLWQHQHLQHLVALSQNYPEAKLYGTRYRDLFKDGTLVAPKLNLNRSEPHFLIADFFEASLFQPIAIPSSFAFQKRIIAQTGGFDPQVTYFEDVDFYIRANLQFNMAYAASPSVLYRFESENQVTRRGLHHEQIADLSSYLQAHPKNKSLANYINRHWYFLCNHFKTAGAQEEYKQMRRQLNSSLLTRRQRLLLKLPAFALRGLRTFKSTLLKNGVRVTSF